MFQAQGKLRYSQNIPGHGQWWLVADFDIDIIKYYQWLFEIENYKKLNIPKYGAHISIIPGEEPKKNIDKWGEFNGEIVLVDVGSPYLIDGTEKNILCLDIKSKRLIELREMFGLGDYPFHLTIGWY